MHPNRRYPYSIDFACFRKCLDRVAVVMVNSPMLARHLDHPPRSKSFPCILLQPLCALFSSAALSFQSLAASFPKTPGWGYLRAASAPSTPARPAGGSRLSPLSDRSSMLFRINTCKSVSKQKTLTSFRINTYKKRGGRGYRVCVATLLPWQVLVISMIHLRSSEVVARCGLDFLRRGIFSGN